MRRVVYGLGVLIVVAVAAALVAPSFIDVSKYQQSILDQVARASGYQVRIAEPVRLSLFPMPSVSARGVAVARADTPQVVLAKIDGVSVSVAFLPLLRGQIEVGQVTLDTPVIHLEKNKTGDLNWGVKPSLEPTPPEKTTKQAIQIHAITVKNGMFVYKEEAQKQEIKLSNMNIKGRLGGAMGPASFTGSARAHDVLWQGSVDLGALDAPDTKMDLVLEAPEYEAVLVYEGTLNAGATPNTKGKLALTTGAKTSGLAAKWGVPAWPAQKMSLAGDIRADSRGVVVENMSLLGAGLHITGFAKYKLPVEVGALPALQARLSAKDAMDLRPWMPPRSAAKIPSKSSTSPPQKQSKMPKMPLDVDVALTVPGIQLGATPFGKTEISIQAQKNDLRGKITIATLPGKGSATVSVWPNGGKGIGASIDMNVADPVVLMRDGLGQVPAPQLAAIKDLSITAEVYGDAQKLSVQKGRIAWTGSDLYIGGSSYAADQITLVLTGQLDATPLMGKAATSTPAASKSGSGKPAPMPPIVLDLHLDQLKLPGQVWRDVIVDASLSGSHIAVKKASGTNAAGQRLGFAGDVAMNGSIYHIKNMRAQVNESDIAGDLTIDLSGGTPRVEGGMNMGALALESVMGVPAPTAKNNSGVPAQRGWSTAPIDTAFLKIADVDVLVAGKTLSYQNWRLDNPAFHVEMKNQKLQVRDLRGDIFGGKLTGDVQVAGRQAGGLTLQSDMDLRGVNAARLTSALLNKKTDQFDGVVALNADIQSDGKSVADLVAHLNGTASSGGENIVVRGVDVARLVSWLRTDLKPSNTVENLMGSFMDGETVFARHEGTYTIQDGVVALAPVVFDGDQASLKTTGSVNLVNWGIDTQSTLQVKNVADVPPVTFAIKGSLNNPAQSFTEGLFENYVQSKLQKRVERLIEKKLGNKLNDLGLGGLIGGGAGGQDASPVPMPNDSGTTQPAPAPIKPEDVLIDVINGLGR